MARRGAGTTSSLFGTGFGGILEVRASGGESPRPLTEIDRSKEEGSHRWPQLLPDRAHLLVTVRSSLDDQRGAYVMSRDGRTKRRLLSTNGDVQLAGSNRLMFLEGDTLVVQAFDERRLQLTGEGTPLASNVGRSSRGNGAFSASATGTVA